MSALCQGRAAGPANVSSLEKSTVLQQSMLQVISFTSVKRKGQRLGMEGIRLRLSLPLTWRN